MDKFIKRIQSRLTREKVQWEGKTVPLWKVRQFYEVFVADRYNPSDEELSLVVEKLTGHCAGEPEPETTSIEPISTPETFDIPVEDMPCLQPPVEESQPEAIAPEIEEGQEDGSLSLQLQEEAQTGSIPETSTSGIVPRESGQLQQPPAIGGITQAQVTQAIGEAIAQVGQQGNSEAVQMLTALANQLSEDIQDTQEMVVALVNAYLSKRQLLLSSAIGTLNNLRTAQTESFQSGLNQSFFGAKRQNKQEFLSKVGAMFN